VIRTALCVLALYGVAACARREPPRDEGPNAAVTVIRVDGGLLEVGPLLEEITQADFEALLTERADALSKACAPRLHAPVRDWVHVRILGNGTVVAEYGWRKPAIQCVADEINKWTVPRTRKSSEFKVRVHVP